MIEGSKVDSDKRTLRYGMVGGGEGSFIGDVHRKVAAFDGKCRIVSGCFSNDFENTLRTGSNLNIEPKRLYKDFKTMAAAEGRKKDRIDFVVIVTPNYAHYDAAKAFLKAGINVVCEKPLVFKVKQAEELTRLAKEKDLLFCVAYCYSGYPLVKQARALVRDGSIGEILHVMGEFPQDWLITPMEKEGQKQAAWRTDPKLAGVSNCFGDLGSHIEHTVAYITGLKIKSLIARLDIIGEGRSLDTNGSVILNFSNGASGVYWASQVAVGNDNALKVRIYGTLGSIEWSQEDPNVMRVTHIGQPVQILSRGHGYLDASAESRIPPGHTEGYFESFANIYLKFASALLKKKDGKELTADDLDFPSLEAGTDGVKFINACVKSSKAGAIWVDL